MEKKEVKIDEKQVKEQLKAEKKKGFIYNLIDKIKKLNKTTKIIIILLVIIAILCLALGIANSETGKLRISATSSLEKIVEKNDLETVNYTYNAIAKQPKNENVSENSENTDDYKYFVSYQGSVSAGIDFKQVKIDVDEKEKKLNVGMPYITKIIQKDARYVEEKESRKSENKEKNKIQKRIYAQNRREKEKQDRIDFERLLIQINKDNQILSTKKKEDDLQYAKWNRSVYEYDKDTSDLVLKNDVNAGYAVSKRVRNIVNPNMIKSNKICV